jgi:AP-2 complex subunit sigma-1
VQLDIVFQFNKVYQLLDEYILAGEIQETSKPVILDRLRDLDKLE